MSEAVERVVDVDVAGERCAAILHEGGAGADVGVVVVVGGPQYRVGSHRQFVLLARALAARGVPVLRFDYRGLGDSAGAARTFETIDDDMRAAIDTLCRESGAHRVVLWGLCDAASAALMYVGTDARIAGLVLLNPWVHSPQTEAQVRLKHYYLARLGNREFWAKLFSGRFDWTGSWRSLRGYAGAALRTRRGGAMHATATEHFIVRMRRGWEAFAGPVLLILSGDDFTAGEFRQLIASGAWRDALARRPPRIAELAAANHTFARTDWRAEVESLTAAWIETEFGRVTPPI